MKRTPAPADHQRTEAGTIAEVGLFHNEGGDQQLIGWRLLLCFALGAGLWLGLIQLLEMTLPGSELMGEIVPVARFVIGCVGGASLCLAGLAGLNETLRRIGLDKDRSPRPRSATSRPSGAKGRLT